MSSTLYDSEFYREQAAGSYLSAKKLLPLVLELIPAKSVLDVGCGVGTFLRAFMELGITDVVGIDGDYVRPDLLQIPPARFQPSDLAKGFKLDRTFDLAISLEVAEHLPREASGRFVHSITQHSKVVLFSAAVPMQGGAGHINEQWASFWARLFEERGYRVYDPFRRSIWADRDIEVWYRQNTLVFASDDALSDFPNLATLMPSALSEIDLVHPQMYIKPATELHKLQEYLRASHIVEVTTAPNGALDLRRR
jgi:SAM-dependent methyltransferase